MKRYILILLILCGSQELIVGQQAENGSQIVKDAPNLNLDCFICDFDYYKRSINFINFVRDVQSADIYVKVTVQSTGTGKKYSIYFEGQNQYTGLLDTLYAVSESDDTSREIDERILSSLKEGLLPFIIISPLKEKIQYEVKQELVNDQAEKISDPWDSWVFSISGSGNYSGESNYNNMSLRGSVSAVRTTSLTKMSLYYSNNYSESNFFFRDSLNAVIDELTITSFRKNQYFNASYIYGLNDHWSLVISSSIWDNSFNNYRLSGALESGIEYNYFPYEESDRRMLTFNYKVGPSLNNYLETTVFDKTEELIWSQKLAFLLAQNQKWGYASISGSFTNYLHNIKLNRLSINPNISWNIFKGFTFGIGSSLSFISNQINLPKEEADIPDVLLRDRLLATNYSFFMFVNIRYTFGSKYANVVNPRFGSGRFGSYFF